MMSNRAAALAVCVAFAVGLLTSLALRPPGERAAGPRTSDSTGLAEQRIHWRLPISITSTTPILGELPLWVSRKLDESSSGAVRLEVFDPGELVPSFSVTDAVRDGKVPAGHTWLGYDQGKIPASALFAATPFGLEPWEYLAWWQEGGGRELADELYARHNIKPLLCGIIGPETAGWFREPIESLDDIQGLKIRFAGIGGKVLERAGASVTMLPGAEIYQALEKGAIDATEFSLPAVDQALGFYRVAKNNYFPGWHQSFTAVHLVINLRSWGAIAVSDQHLITQACDAATLQALAASEARQGAVIAGFPELGVVARYLDMDILRELQRLSVVVMREESEKDADFARILESQNTFRASYQHWKQLGYLPRDF